MFSNKSEEKYAVSSTSYKDQLENYKKRLYNERLIWCRQVKNILKKEFNFSKNLTINDIGCGYFPFYKELKLSKLKHDYLGIDLDKTIINAGLKKFPELKNKYRILNIEQLRPIRSSDITVVSSLIEHLNHPLKTLKYLMSYTKKCLILRIPIIKGFSISTFVESSAINHAWKFKVFSEKKIISFFDKTNFIIKIIDDEAVKKQKKHSSKFLQLLKKNIVIIKAIRIQK